MWRALPGVDPDVQRLSRRITVVGALAFWLLLCAGRPWRLFTRGGFSTDFYDVQARSFLEGRLRVPSEVAGIEGFVNDGSTYLYFGPTLAIARLPTAALGSWFDGRLTRLSMLIAFVVLCTATHRLVLAVGRLVGVDGLRPWQPAVIVAMVVCSPALWLASEPFVYQETELWAAAMLVLVLALLAELLDEPSRRTAVLVAALVLVVVSTRASVGLGAATAAMFVGVVLWRRGSPRLAIGLLTTSVASVVSSFLLTYAKLGAFDLPADQQVASIVDPDRMAWFAGNGNSFFRADFIPTTLLHYLRPDGLDVGRVFPFVAPPTDIDVLGDYPLETYTPTASLTVTAPLVVVLALVGLVLVVRGRHGHVLGLTLGAGVAAGPALAIGFVAGRYLLDLMPAMVLLGTVAVVRTGERLADHSRRVAGGGLALLGWGFGVNLLLAVGAIGLASPGFIEFRHGLDDAVFGGSAVDVVRVDAVPSAEGQPVGLLAVAGDCDGLYVSDSILWQPVERADGALVRLLRFDPATTSMVLEGAGGSLFVEPLDGTLDVWLALPDGRALVEAVPWRGGSVELEIVSDPWAGGLLRGLYVWVDGEPALRDLFTAPDLAAMVPQAGVTEVGTTGGDVPTCRSLLERGIDGDR